MKTKTFNIRPIVGKRGTRFEARIYRAGRAESKTFATERDARAWLLQTDAALARGEMRQRAAIDVMTMKEALANYACLKDPDKAWAGIELGRIRRLQRHRIARLKLVDIRPSDLLEYMGERQQAGKKHNTIRLELVVLRQAFKQSCLQHNVIDIPDPFKPIKKPRTPRRPKRRFEGGELERMCAALRADAASFVRLAVETAMRRSELLALTWSRVNLEKREIRDVLGKDGDIVDLPLTEGAVKILREIARIPGEDRIFQFTADYISGAFYRAKKKLGFKGLKLHTCRGEGTSRFLDMGMPVHQVQTLTRHKTLAMVEQYANGRVNDARETLIRAENRMKHGQSQ
jgi:integrase